MFPRTEGLKVMQSSKKLCSLYGALIVPKLTGAVAGVGTISMNDSAISTAWFDDFGLC